MHPLDDFFQGGSGHEDFHDPQRFEFFDIVFRDDAATDDVDVFGVLLLEQIQHPLEKMHVEPAIAEDDQPYVLCDMPVHVVLDAFPLQSYESQIQHVHPRAELIEQQNVFVAKTLLDNPHQKLLPGMRGRAHIKAGTARIGWIIFRRPLATVLEWLGW